MGPWQDLDQRLAPLAAQWGGWLYVVLFAAVLLQTGCVLGPALPGNPLLLATGLLLSQTESSLPIGWVLALLGLAAWLGCAVNYGLGRWLGERWIANSKWANQPRLDRARRFLAERGAWAVALGVFLPVIRSWLPFLAGMSAMRPTLFFGLTGLASFTWVGLVAGSGYWLGGLPWIDSVAGVVAAAFGLTVVGAMVAAVRNRRRCA